MAEGADKEKENGQEVVEMGNNKGNHNNCIDSDSDGGKNGVTSLTNGSVNYSSNGLIKMSISKSKLAPAGDLKLAQEIEVNMGKEKELLSENVPLPNLYSCHTINENGNGSVDQLEQGQGEGHSYDSMGDMENETKICESQPVVHLHNGLGQGQGEGQTTNGNGDAGSESGSESTKYQNKISHEEQGESNVGSVATASDCVDGDTARRHLKSSSLPHGVKLCPESKDRSDKSEEGNVNGSGTSGESQDGEEEDESKGDKWAVLEEELRKAHCELKAKDAEVEQLKGIRQQVEGELTDLTAALFEEAHKMVQAAKMKEVSSEKSLKEAKMQLDGLQAEVAALKTLLITSTPSRPNLGGNGISIFKKQHKRCPSHNHLQYGRSEDEPDGKEKRKHDKCGEVVVDRERCEVDPHLHALFGSWRQEPTLIVNHNNNKSQFLQKIYTEDIDPCLSFSNDALVQRLRQAVEENSIWVEPIPEKDKHNVPTECALVRCPRICHYRMRFAYDSDEWFDISQLCRDRIAAVCEFLNYLRYIKNGLVKASVDDAYWEIIRLRKQMALAKLGIPIS